MALFPQQMPSPLSNTQLSLLATYVVILSCFTEPEAVDLAYAAEELEALDRRMSEQARAAVEGRHAGMYSKR